MELEEGLRKLEELGVEFGLNIPHVAGAMPCLVSKADLFELMEDPVGLYARIYGVSRRDYLAWMENEGNLRCSANTASGRRCKNIVPRGYQLPAAQWAARQGEYCHIHEHGPG